MLRSANELKGYGLLAKDGEIGRCKDFLFDDEFWTVRYMVADTRKWLPGRKVLISPIVLCRPDWGSGRFPVELTRERIKNQPALDEDAPVSRQYERRYHRHYGWPMYWGGVEAWGAFMYPERLLTVKSPEGEPKADEDPDSHHLRSVAEVTDYVVENGNEKLGRVSDFIVEDGTWAIRYLVVDTGNWLTGRKVLASPTWIESVSWKDQQVSMWLTREEIKDSPPYDPAAPINRKTEEFLYDYYGRPAYWKDREAVHTASR
ncbi:MAG: PRC-barrel domain-containing protein [Verrucomicrobia bacterium]|nr:PRC-barrel domain-containing protein [Verrucomicrobiota bacterium]